MLCKGAHRHADADAVLIEQVHDLIVHDIIIALINTPTIRAALQRMQNRFMGRIETHYGNKSIGNGFRMLQIETRRVIGTGVPVHTAIQTVLRCAVRLVRGIKVRKRAEAADFPARASDQPCQNVRIVAAFLPGSLGSYPRCDSSFRAQSCAPYASSRRSQYAESRQAARSCRCRSAP